MVRRGYHNIRSKSFYSKREVCPDCGATVDNNKRSQLAYSENFCRRRRWSWNRRRGSAFEKTEIIRRFFA